MKKNVILTLVLLLTSLLLKAQTPCPNAVVNGDFEAGNTGFTSSLASNCQCVANSFCVNTNFNLKCPGWPNFGNHTSGGSNFMLIDGSDVAATNVWSTTVPVSPGDAYTFSFWVASVYTTNQQVFDLGMVVNGVIVKQFTVSQVRPNWTQYTFSGVCPPNLRSIPIAIRQMSAGGFRDFGLDDIYFACCPCKADYTTTNLDNCRNFQFNNTSTGAGVTYSWDFGDTASGVNNTSSLANPTHLFSKCGTYEVCLTLKGEGCSSKICYSVDATDSFAPLIACPRNLTVNTNPGQCYYTGTLPQPTVSDNCAKAPEIICSLLTPTSSILITPQTQFPKGVNTISCIARDECGNTSKACTYTLTVKDNQAPVITCPISMSVLGVKDAEGRCKALISGQAPTVTDNCPMTTLTYAVTGATTASGSNNLTEVNFMEGLSTVTYTAVDMDGNKTSCSFTITVRCPCQAGFNITYLNDCGNVQFTNTSTGTAPLTYSWNFGDPNSGTANTSTLQNPSHQFSKCDTFEVCLTITGNGCSSKVCKTVVVKDDQAPKIVCPPNVTVSTNPGQCYFSGKLVDPKATDNCDKELEIICTIFAPNRPIIITPQTQFAKGEHLITCYAIDDCGNWSEACTYTLTVVDKELPIITCPANVTVQGTLNPDGLCKAVVKDIAPKASDNCPMLGVNWRLSGATIGQGIADASGTNFMQGVTTVTYTAVDMAGNEARCSFTVTVECKPPPNDFPGFECGQAVITCFSGFMPGSTNANPNGPVLAIFDVRNHATAPLGVNWANAGIYHASNWTAQNMGQIFGVTIDKINNVYATATTIYGRYLPGNMTNADFGNVYKIDATTGQHTKIATLPQDLASPAGLGDIWYDETKSQLFVSNFYDGKIYRMNTSGTLIGTPYQFSGVPGSPFFTSSPGFAPLGQRVWAVARNGSKLYFSVWCEDRNPNRNSTAVKNQIYSVQLDPTTGAPIPSTTMHEVDIPDFITTSTSAFSSPVSDITFSNAGKMLVAERSMYGDVGDASSTAINVGLQAHASRILEFSGPNWSNNVKTIYVGNTSSNNNSAGGVDYGYEDGNPASVQFPTLCDSMVWGTGDALRFPGYNIIPDISNWPGGGGIGDYVYGLAGMRSSGNSNISSSNNYVKDKSIYIDADHIIQSGAKVQIGDVDVFKCGCPGQSSFCDSISVTSMPVADAKDSCCFKLTLNNQKPNFFTAIQLCSSNGVSISDVSVLNGCSLQSFGATQVTIVPAGGVSSTFPGGSKDFIRFCLSNYETVPNQQIIVKYYGPNFEVVCMDTLSYNCTQKPKCIKITNDTITCSENGKYKLQFCIMSDALIPWAVSTFVLNPPAGVTFTPSTFTLNTPLQPGQMSCTFTTEISGPSAIDGKEICFSVTAHKQSVPPHLDCCTDTVMRACVILPTCICDKVSVNVTPVSSPKDTCCWKINLINNYSTTYFTGVQLEILTPGVIFGAIDNGFPTWGLTYNPTQAIFKKIPLGTFIGTTSALPTFCLAGINNSTPMPQIVVLRWLGPDGKTVCEDTLKFNCKPPIESDCAVIVKPKIECDTTFIGTYNLSFQVQNNSGHTINQVVLNSVTGGIVNPVTFTIPSLANGGTSGILTTQIIGVQPGVSICFLLTVHEKGANGEDLNCCTHSQKYCFVIPDCCQCGTFSDLTFRPAKGAPNMPIKCGDTLGVSCNPQFNPIIAGNFQCIGECAADSIHWELVSLSPMLPVASGNVSSGNFSLAILAAYFSTPGMYELTLSSKCGKQTCPPCKLIIKAAGCPCCEDFDVFCQSMMNHVEIKVDSVKCKATLTVCNIRACDYIQSISWGDGGNSAGPFGPGAMAMHTYTGSGTYIISYLAIEKDPVTGKICFEKRFSDTITLVCKGCACKGADGLSFGGFQIASDFAATCGSQTPVELPCSAAGAFFYFHGDVYCDGDSCLSDQIGWSIGQGNLKILSGTMPMSHIFPGGNKGHFDLINLDPAMFTPGVVYTLTIGWNCGGKSCSCTVRFVFKGCPDCACGKFTEVFLRPNSGPSIALSCGEKGPLVPCPVVGQPFNFTGAFACQGDNCPKTTPVKWTLIGPDGVAVAMGTVTAMPNFSINLSPALFSKKGEYCLKLEGYCGAKLCECLLKFRLEAPCSSSDCVCGTYSGMFIRSGQRPSIPVVCGCNPVPVGCPPNGQNLVLTGQFQCQGQECPKTTLMDWVLIGPNGPLPIASGTGVIASPNFSISILPSLLTQAGVYTLKLIGHCGKLECPCVISFIMDPPCPKDPCECGNFTDLSFRPAKGAPNMAVKCGDTIDVSCNPQFDPIISGNFQCVGKNCPTAPMHWELRVLPSNTVVAMGDVNLSPGFSLALPAAYFSTPGMYELVFTGDCGNTQSCTPFTFIINATGCPCCEDYDLFCQSVAQAVTLSVDSLNCKATLSVGNLRKCDVIQDINWGDGNQSTGPFTAGAVETHFYVGKGPFIVSWLALEYNAAGKVCFEKVFRDTIELKCDSSCNCSTYEMSVKIGKANLQVRCGDTIDVPGNFSFYGEFGCIGNACPESPGVGMAWTLSGPPGFIEESGLVVVKSDIFIPSLGPANLTIPGLYALTLGASCGENSCPCTIYFQVSDYCCKDSAVFLQNAKSVQTNGTLGNCTLSFQATGLTDCMRILYDWGDGDVTGYIAGNNVPITHTYAAPGKYVVCYTILEFNNKVICQRYFHCDTIEVKCRCDCGVLEWATFLQLYGNFTSPIRCDNNTTPALQVPCPKQGQNYFIHGNYRCMPDTCGSKIVNWVLDRPGNLSDISGVSNSFYPHFDINLQWHLCTTPGTYVLKITRNCGGKECVCAFKFEVPACPCLCGKLKEDVALGFNAVGKQPLNSCKRSFIPTALCPGDIVTWSVNGGVVPGTTTGNNVKMITFNGPGIYLICMTVLRTDANGQKCEGRFCQKVKVKCNPGGFDPNITFCPNDVVKNGDFTEGAIAGHLGETGVISGWKLFPNAGRGFVFVNDSTGSGDAGHLVLNGGKGNFAGVWQKMNLQPNTFTTFEFDYKNYLGKNSPTKTVLEFRLESDTIPGGPSQILHRQTISDTSTAWSTTVVSVRASPNPEFKYLIICAQNDNEALQSLVGIDNLTICTNSISDTKQLSSLKPIRIFPNPNPGKFTVELPQPATTGMSLRVTDLAGRLVLEKSTEAGNLQQTIQAEYLSNGMYFLQVVEKGRVVGVEKFVKQ